MYMQIISYLVIKCPVRYYFFHWCRKSHHLYNTHFNANSIDLKITSFDFIYNYLPLNFVDSFPALLNMFTYRLPTFTLQEIQIMLFLLFFCRSSSCFVWKCSFEIAMQCFIYTNMVLCGIYHVYTLGFHHQVSINLSEIFLDVWNFSRYHDMSSLIFLKNIFIKLQQIIYSTIAFLTIFWNKS